MCAGLAVRRGRTSSTPDKRGDPLLSCVDSSFGSVRRRVEHIKYNVPSVFYILYIQYTSIYIYMHFFFARYNTICLAVKWFSSCTTTPYGKAKDIVVAGGWLKYSRNSPLDFAVFSISHPLPQKI